MRLLKLIAWLLTGVLTLIALCIVLLFAFFNPNDYKDTLQLALSKQIGRQVTLQGELHLTLLPWLGLAVNSAHVANAPGFGEEPFMNLEQATVRVRLRPLLHKQIEIDEVRLDGLTIRLLTNAQGGNNWSDLGNGSDNHATPDPEAAATSAGANFTLAHFSLNKGLLIYQDAQSGSAMTLRDFTMRVDQFALTQPFKVQTSFTLEQAAQSRVTTQLTSTVTLQLANNVYQFDQPHLALTIQGSQWPQQGVPMTLSAQQLRIALNEQTATATALALTLANAKLNAELQATQLLTTPQLTGSFTLEPFSLTQCATQLGITLPPTRNAHSLQRLGATSQFTASATALTLNPLTLKLDDSTVQGQFSITDLERKALDFDLKIDHINLDDYAAPVAAQDAAPVTAAEPTPIPVERLRALAVRGVLSVDQAVVHAMRLQQVRVKLQAQAGRLRINPLQAALYEGRYQGDIQLDVSGAVPTLQLEQQVQGINFAPLLQEVFNNTQFAGRGNANVQLRSTGADTAVLQKNLQGKVDFNVTQGAFEGVDMWYEIARARALLKQQPVPEPAKTPRTAFDTIEAAGTLNAGVLQQKTLVISTRTLSVNGTGAVNLLDDTVDYRLNVQVRAATAADKDAEQLQDLKGLDIPVRISGALTDPKVRPDLSGYVKGKAKQRVEEEKQKLEEKVKTKLQDKLRDFLSR